MTIVKGIDVSNHQGIVDWERVRADGIQFAYIKATEGVGFVDERMSSNSSGAKAAGIPRGFYHYGRPDTQVGRSVETARDDAEAEADFFLARVLPAGGDLLPVLDLEERDVRKDLVAEWAKAWLRRVADRIGAKPMLYFSPSYWTDVVGSPSGFGSHPLWIAHYAVSSPTVPGPFRRYTVWQYTSEGRVPGVTGFVDMNQLHEKSTVESITVDGAGPPPPPQNLPGPVPKPTWFWVWLRWHFGFAEFTGLKRNPAVRPDEAPEHIPRWAWKAAQKMDSARARD